MVESHMHDHNGHSHSLSQEFFCHFPYAIFSVCFGLIILSFLDYITAAQGQMPEGASDVLFHSFHFLHIIFAATGTVLTFLKFSKSLPKALFIGIVSPTFFCIISDVVIPYIGGTMLGVDMEFHICFYSELTTVLPFLLIGIINGFIMNRHFDKLDVWTTGSHFLHILVSSFASTFYLVSHGLGNWASHMGLVFLFLVVAVLLPCTLSDVVVPMMFAQAGKRK